MEISWTDPLRNEKVLRIVKDKRNITHRIYERMAFWIGHILGRNCLLNYLIERKIEGRKEVKGRRGRRQWQLVDDLKEKRGCWKLKEEALYRSVWRTRFGRVCGLVIRQTE
jgi:hypothetical protein